jgi:hypothetical protein
MPFDATKQPAPSFLLQTLQFSRQKLGGEDEVPYETDVTGVIVMRARGTRGGRGLPYLVVLKYSIIRTKSNFNLFTPFTLFSFSTHCSDQTTIVNNNFCPLNILKSTKMKYYLIYFITYRIIALRRTSGKSEVV